MHCEQVRLGKAMIPEAQALTGKRPRDVADEHAREEEARAMMARFIAPIKREFRLSHDGGAGCESVASTYDTTAIFRPCRPGARYG